MGAGTSKSTRPRFCTWSVTSKLPASSNRTRLFGAISIHLGCAVRPIYAGSDDHCRKRCPSIRSSLPPCAADETAQRVDRKRRVLDLNLSTDRDELRERHVVLRCAPRPGSRMIPAGGSGRQPRADRPRTDCDPAGISDQREAVALFEVTGKLVRTVSCDATRDANLHVRLRRRCLFQPRRAQSAKQVVERRLIAVLDGGVQARLPLLQPAAWEARPSRAQPRPGIPRASRVPPADGRPRRSLPQASIEPRCWDCAPASAWLIASS